MKTWKPPATAEELYEKTDGNKFSFINRPTAGARDTVELSNGNAAIQLYSLATPNGQKVGILLEELGVEYDAHTVNIGTGAQFGSGFVSVNPNSKIPCATDGEIRLFESGAILTYFANKYNKLIPDAGIECMNWVFWAQAQAFTTGNYGHFFVYAPSDENRDYGVSRYAMEVQRLCSVLDNHLEHRRYMCGDEYSIADIACLPWFALLRNPEAYQHESGVLTKNFLNMQQYKHANRWADELLARPQVQRGMLVCRGKHGKPWLVDSRFKHLANL